MQRVQNRSSAGEIRSHIPHGQKYQNTKEKQYYDKFNRDLKMAYIKTFIIIKKWYQCRFTLRHATSSDPHLEHKSQQCMFQSINSFQVENTHMIFTSLKFSFLIWEMEILIIELCVCVCARSVIQSCLTLCDPIDYSPPGSSVHGIFQERILEWVAISYSKGSSGPRN